MADSRRLLRFVPLLFLLVAVIGPTDGQWLLLPPGFGAHWQITTTQQGTWVSTYIDSSGTTTSTTTQWPGPPMMATSLMPNNQASLEATGTYTISADWVDQSGLPAPNPPSRLNLLFTSSASWGMSVGDRSASEMIDHAAGDGWYEDAEMVTETGGGWSGASGGRHLITFDGSSGHVQRVVPIHAFVKAHVTSTNGMINASCGVSAVTDPRGASILCSLDPTYRRIVNGQGQPVRAVNVADPSNGAMYGDTLDVWSTPAGQITATFYATIAGNWGSNSYYHWYDSYRDLAQSGTFALPSPLPDPLHVTYATFPFEGPNDHVHLRVQDSSDPALQCTANYWLRFHGVCEDWTTTQRTSLPRSIRDFAGDWPYILYQYDNYTGAIVDKALSTSVTVTDSMSGTVGGELSLEVQVAKLSANESISVGASESYTVIAGTTLHFPPWEKVEIRAAMSAEDRVGTCSVWKTDGYKGDFAWAGRWVGTTAVTGARVLIEYPH